MSKRNKGQRAKARAAKLAALRAEVVLLFEEKLDKRFLQYNIQTTQKLIDEFHMLNGAVPPWAQRYVQMSKASDPTAWIGDDRLDAYARALDHAMVTGTGVVRLTTGQHSGTIMDMD